MQRTSDTGPRAAELNGQVGSDGRPPLQGQRFAVLADRAKWLYLTVQQGEWYHGCPVKAIYRLSSLKVFALKDGSLFSYNGCSRAKGFPGRGKLSPQVTDESAGKQLLPGNHPSSGTTRHPFPLLSLCDIFPRPGEIYPQGVKALCYFRRTTG